jgi:hypothetical protein
MIDPQVEHGGASSWFWIVENGFGVAAGCGALAASAVFVS